jgi:alkylated DNA repair dioxygenase AlkB
MLSDPVVNEVMPVDLGLLEGEARLWRVAFSVREATALLEDLRQTIEWQQEEILILGRRVSVPRLVAWHGDPGAHYSYSGTDHVPRPWTPTLEAIRERASSLTGAHFNSVLLNFYRSGRDGMGWHADDEAELGRNPVIASVSLGASRRFCLRHRKRAGLRIDVTLTHGSLLCMSGATQHRWLHALPKTRASVGPRINLTFRYVHVR